IENSGILYLISKRKINIIEKVTAIKYLSTISTHLFGYPVLSLFCKTSYNGEENKKDNAVIKNPIIIDKKVIKSDLLCTLIFNQHPIPYVIINMPSPFKYSFFIDFLSIIIFLHLFDAAELIILFED